MSDRSAIDGYLRELRRELVLRGVRDRRVVAEARAHLLEAAEVFERGGLSRQEAERSALSAFGAAANVAAATAVAGDRRRSGWRTANETSTMNRSLALALGLVLFLAAVAAGALVLGEGDDRRTAAQIETAAGLKRPRTAASHKADLYRTCADIPGIVYEGQDEWSTRGWVNVANGKLIQAWCSTVSAGGRDG